MHLTDDDVIKILKLVQESDFVTMHLEYGDLKLSVSKGGDPAAAPVLQAQAAAAVPSAPAENKPAQQASAAAASPSASPAKDDQKDDEAGLVAIRAPMVGTFYIAPEPGADPFVDIEAGRNKVEEETIVGLIETMKVFNNVMAGVKGEVVKRLVSNAQFVEYNQPLFLVRPLPEEGSR